MYLRGKKIVVTGGNGFLGSWVIKKLCEAGVDPECIRSPSSSQCDLRTRSACQAVCQAVDVVIHTAAITGVGSFHKDYPGSIFYDNLMMSVELMEAARHAGVKKFLSIGSATEYPANARAPFQEETLWDGYPEASHAPYSMTKRMMSVQSQAYRAQYGFNAIHLLPPNLYGPGSKDFYVIPSLIKKIIDAKKNNQHEIEVWGTGNATREFLYVEDAAEAVVLALEHYNASQPVNIGTGVEVSIKELVDELAQILDFTGSVRYNSSVPEDHKRRLLNTEKAHQKFGFIAKTSLRQGLQKTIAALLGKNQFVSHT